VRDHAAVGPSGCTVEAEDCECSKEDEYASTCWGFGSIHLNTRGSIWAKK